MIKVKEKDRPKTRNMIKDINISLRLKKGEARVGKVGPGQRGRICDDSDDAPKQRYEVSEEET